MSTVWGIPVNSLYQYVLQHYKKEKDKLRLDYAQRVELLALFKQVKLGTYSPDKDTETGYFDVIGSDRRKAWIALGNRSKEEAQAEVVRVLEGVCPTLKEAVLVCLKEASQTQSENMNEVTAEECLGQQQASCHEEEQKGEGGVPLKKAGSDYFTSTTNSSSFSSSSPALPLNNHPSKGLQAQPQLSHLQRPQPHQALPQRNLPHSQPRYSALAPAALWCSPKSAREFVTKMQTSTSSSANRLNLAPGERVLVQVPTSPQASAIIWEFATEQGDVGFGLNFQRCGEVQKAVQQLLPVTPRDCGVDLVLGKHQYQEQGTYLLEFVNTHSTRPKIVYYRVFYQDNMISR